jgi:hypothetical protein
MGTGQLGTLLSCPGLDCTAHPFPIRSPSKREMEKDTDGVCAADIPGDAGQPQYSSKLKFLMALVAEIKRDVTNKVSAYSSFYLQ